MHVRASILNTARSHFSKSFRDAELLPKRRSELMQPNPPQEKQQAYRIVTTRNGVRWLILNSSHCIENMYLTKFMHKFKMRFVFHFYIPGLTSWIWTNSSTEGLEFESPSRMKRMWGLQSWTLLAVVSPNHSLPQSSSQTDRANWCSLGRPYDLLPRTRIVWERMCLYGGPITFPCLMNITGVVSYSCQLCIWHCCWAT